MAFFFAIQITIIKGCPFYWTGFMLGYHCLAENGLTELKG